MKLFTLLASTRALQGTPYAQLNASNYSANAKFGSAVAISATGLVVIVGAPEAAVGTIARAGIVYIYDSATVTETAVLADAAPVVDEQFGFSIALSADGNTLAIGAPGATVNSSTLAGCVYIYRKTGTEWIKQAKIISLNPQYHAGFGHSIALSADGNRVAIGAPRHTLGGKVLGYACVYEYNIAYQQTYYDWHFYTEFTQTMAGYDNANAGFGWKVSLSDDGAKLAISAPFMFITEAGAGAVFVATSLTSHTLAMYYSDSLISDGYFGLGLALNASGDTIFVGEPGSSNPLGVTKTGAVHVMPIDRSWRGKYWVNTPQTYAQLGFDVATVGDTFVASAIVEDTSVADTGAVYVFSKASGTWEQKLDFDGMQVNGYFGSSIAISATGNLLAIGAKGETYNGLASGNVYLIF